MLNKKAVAIDDLVEALITMIFIVILIFFFVNYQIHKQNADFQEINKLKVDIEADEVLLSYLQKNITFDTNNDGVKEKIMMKDLIIFSFLKDKKDIYEILEEETKKILVEFKRSDKSAWNIQMYLYVYPKLDYKKRLYVDISDFSDSRTTSPEVPESITTLSEAISFLPLGKDGEYIRIILQEVGRA